MTNQNDTQDEAERLAEEFIILEREQSGIEDFQSLVAFDRSIKSVFIKGYRAGVASREEIILVALKNQAVSLKQITDSRAEVERLKACITGMDLNRDEYHKRFVQYDNQLTAEKARAQKLVEALGIFLDDLSSGPKLSKVTEALSAYSTDSGDGGGK